MSLHPKLRASGISEEVASSRPYVEFTDDIGPVRNAFAKWPRALRADVVKKANLALPGGGGLIMVRHAPPGINARRIPPRLRPNVETPENPKYAIPPNPLKDSPWSHDHADVTARDVDHLAGHLVRWHGAKDGPLSWQNLFGEVHSHVSRVKDRSNGYGKRLDLHPMALPLLPTAERVFFVLEGEIKADAILSKGEAVFSVPSVTLWDAPELERFAKKYLDGKEVVIVCDSDWADPEKPVLLHAMCARTFLRNRGIQASVAAPPSPDGAKVGVDDFLASGGSMEDLLVLDRSTAWGNESFFNLVFDMQSWRSDRSASFARTVEGLASIAVDGRVQTSLVSLARVIDSSRQTVSRRLEEAKAYGVIEVDETMTTNKKWRPDRKSARGRFMMNGPYWVGEPPVITLHPSVRAAERTLTLRAYLKEIE